MTDTQDGIDQNFVFKDLPDQFKSILESLNECLVLVDDFGALRFVNNRFLELTGFSKEEIIGKRIYEVYFPEGSIERENEAALIRSRWKDRRKGLSSIYETEIVRKDGTRRLIETRAAPLYSADGSIVGSIGAISDLTEKKFLEEELRWSQKMDVVGRLAGGVAHDFNNLLTVIQGYVDLLQAEIAEDDPKQKRLRVIKDASETAALMTQQLLSLSKKDVYNLEKFQLNDLIINSAKLINGMLGDRISLELDLTDDSSLIQGDIGQVQRIILNLAVNAKDAMPQGGILKIQTVPIFKTLKSIDNKQDCIQLRVVDTGVGMTKEVLSRIFEPMFSTKSHAKGSGLGLTVTFNIVQQHNAEIMVQSKLGKGTEFIVTFPRVEIIKDESSKVVSISSGLDSASFYGQELILVVEDNFGVRSLISDTLDKYGYQVLMAKDAEDAISLINGSNNPKIDLLITDLVMPGMSGIQLIDYLKNNYPLIKFLVMSGCPEDYEDKLKIQEDGIDYIAKPFSQDKFLGMVRKVLNTSEVAGKLANT